MFLPPPVLPGVPQQAQKPAKTAHKEAVMNLVAKESL